MSPAVRGWLATGWATWLAIAIAILIDPKPSPWVMLGAHLYALAIGIPTGIAVQRWSRER